MEALGPVLLLFSIPMILRWIPQNQLIGFRPLARDAFLREAKRDPLDAFNGRLRGDHGQ
jgi:hypothetical protein